MYQIMTVAWKTRQVTMHFHTFDFACSSMAAPPTAQASRL